ncbi:MAG: hypothetical protein ACK55Z_02640, partial [bacterium]
MNINQHIIYCSSQKDVGFKFSGRVSETLWELRSIRAFLPMGTKRVEPEEQEEEYEEEEEEEEEELKRNRRAAMAGTKARGAK